MIWNHGSERNPDPRPQFDTVAAIFVPAGYVVSSRGSAEPSRMLTIARDILLEGSHGKFLVGNITATPLLRV